MNQSEVDISLNHDVMASFLLHKWPWVLINSSECMKRDNIHVVTEGIALGGEYDAIRTWLYGVTGKSIVIHQSVTSQKHQIPTLYPITLAVGGFFQQNLTCEVIQHTYTWFNTKNDVGSKKTFDDFSNGPPTSRGTSYQHSWMQSQHSNLHQLSRKHPSICCIRSRKQGDTDGTSNIVLPCLGS